MMSQLVSLSSRYRKMINCTLSHTQSKKCIELDLEETAHHPSDSSRDKIENTHTTQFNTNHTHITTTKKHNTNQNRSYHIQITQTDKKRDLEDDVHEQSADAESLQVSSGTPELDVVLEGQEVEHAVQRGDEEGEGQEVGVGLQQHALHLVGLALAGRSE